MDEFFQVDYTSEKTGSKVHVPTQPPFRNSKFFLKPLRNNFETPLRKLKSYGGGRGWILDGMVDIKTKVLTQHFSPQKFLSKTHVEGMWILHEMARCSSQILFQNVIDNVKCSKYLFQEKGIYHPHCTV